MFILSGEFAFLKIMKITTPYLTLLACTAMAFLFNIGLYAWRGHNPSNRLAYASFVSIVPALGALVVVKVSKRSLSWKGIAAVYALLFVLTVIIQALLRMIPIN